jgi:hypothetical protein
MSSERLSGCERPRDLSNIADPLDLSRLSSNFPPIVENQDSVAVNPHGTGTPYSIPLYSTSPAWHWLK